MVYVTVIIPIGEAHVDIAHRAIASAQKQTEPVNVLYEIDTAHVGPGALRNRMLTTVTTPFVVFLDADDWIAPTFVEETLSLARKTGKYVFTDWLEGTKPVVAPEKPWCGGTWHVITALLPTAWAKEVGGFDETLPAMEDTDFYLRLTTRHLCGVRLPKALFTYSDGGLRSDEFRQSGDIYEQVKGEIQRRYAGMTGCCGQDEIDIPPIGERMNGDVLCQAQWQGKHTEASQAMEGRIYPRIAFPATTWVNERDARANPHLWRIIEKPVDEAQLMSGLDGLELAMRIAQGNEAPAVEYVPPSAEPVQAKPNVSKVRQLGAKKRK